MYLLIREVENPQSGEQTRRRRLFRFLPAVLVPFSRPGNDRRCSIVNANREGAEREQGDRVAENFTGECVFHE